MVAIYLFIHNFLKCSERCSKAVNYTLLYMDEDVGTET